MTNQDNPHGREATWRGEPDVLPEGVKVIVLAIDPVGQACWVRWWPEGRGGPTYRSCDLSDVELSDPVEGPPAP